MISNRHTAHRVRRWGAGAGLGAAGGIVVAAAITGMGVARAEEPNPADLLDSAYTEFTDANQVLSQADVADNLNLASFVYSVIAGQDTNLQILGQVQSAEELITSHDGSLSGPVNDVLIPLDQNWYQASEAAYSAAQAFDTAVASGSGVDSAVEAAQFGLVAADFQSLVDTFSSIPVIFASLLF